MGELVAAGVPWAAVMDLTHAEALVIADTIQQAAG